MILQLTELDRLLGIQEQLDMAAASVNSDNGGVGTSAPLKIQYVVLLEKKLSVAEWEIEELRAQVLALKSQQNNDATIKQLRIQLDNVTNQRDELLSERGQKSRNEEEQERSLVTQLEEISRARAQMAIECKRIESDCASRVEALYSTLDQLQHQRDDLLSEQRKWRREKDELLRSMQSQLDDLTKQKEQLQTENLQLKSQIVHLTPINVEANNNNRFKTAPTALSSITSKSDSVPERKPPSASLKSKLEEWNKQRDRLAEEQNVLHEQVINSKTIALLLFTYHNITCRKQL